MLVKWAARVGFIDGSHQNCSKFIASCVNEFTLHDHSNHDGPLHRCAWKSICRGGHVQ